MFEQPRLSATEWELIADLLEQELRELPVEIRHTRSADLSGELHRRMEILQDVLRRVRAATVEPSAV